MCHHRKEDALPDDEQAQEKKGGVGVKQVGVHKRKIKPNLQKRTIWVDGKPQKVWLSTQAIRGMDPTLFVNPNKL